MKLSLSQYQGLYDLMVDKSTAKNGNTYLRFVFSKVKCRKCPLCEQCRVGQSKSQERGYSLTQPNEKNQQRLVFEKGDVFRERLRIRHRIEEKNGEMKLPTVWIEPIPWVLRLYVYKHISRHLW